MQTEVKNFEPAAITGWQPLVHSNLMWCTAPPGLRGAAGDSRDEQESGGRDVNGRMARGPLAHGNIGLR